LGVWGAKTRFFWKYNPTTVRYENTKTPHRRARCQTEKKRKRACYIEWEKKKGAKQHREEGAKKEGNKRFSSFSPAL